MIITLRRFAMLPLGTLGKLEIPDGPEIFILERPWLDNRPFVSCIPTADYPLEWDLTGRVKNCPRLRDTAPRTQINIHTANRVSELHGCLAPGMEWHVDAQTPRVSSSNTAFALLVELLVPGPGKLLDGDPMLDVDREPITLRIR